MRILLVDNGTKHLDGLLRITSKHTVKVVKPEDLKDSEVFDVADYDAAILSGSFEQTVASDPELYEAEMELVRAGELPILGAGLGFEIICYALGTELAELADKDSGSCRISPTSDGAKIFQGSDPILINEVQRWCVDDLPKSLQRLATSETGIEAVRHKTLPVYGIQFLPEDFTYPSDGKLVFDNILLAFDKK